MGFPELLNLPLDPFKGNDNPTVSAPRVQLSDEQEAKREQRRAARALATERRKALAERRRCCREYDSADVRAAATVLAFIRREMASASIAEDYNLSYAMDRLSRQIEKTRDSAARRLGINS